MIKQFAHRFFCWFCHPEYYDEIVGDLEEIYQRRVEQGRHRAQWQYLLQVLVLFRPSLMRSISSYSLTNSAMFRHYFNISTRVLLRHKFYSFINILGLAVGMGVCLLIYQYIHFELSYDRFHSNAENIYRFTQIYNNDGVGVSTTFALGPTEKENIPEIEDFVRIHPQYEGLIVANPDKNDPYQEDHIWYVDSNFLQVFNFPLKYGNSESALTYKHSIVITEQVSAKYFGDRNPVGKILKVIGGSLGGDFVVKGVLKELPENSHLQFELLMPMVNLLENYGPYKKSDGWVWENFLTYFIMNESADLTEVGKKSDQLITRYTGEKLARLDAKPKTRFEPVTDIHLRTGPYGDIGNNQGSINDVRAFGVIALFILLIAWINYINLSTARAMHRAKEVGVRKSIGALKKQLVGQFLVESVLINLLAAIIAIGVAYSMLPILNHMIGKDLSLDILQHSGFWIWFSAIFVLGSILSGLYPAFVLSSFQPISIQKSVKLTRKGRFNLRRSLIVFQFLTSLLLISGAYLVYQQITYIKNYELGIDMEKILVISGPRILDYDNLRSSYETFKNEAIRHHSIISISGTGTVPGTGNMFTDKIWRADRLPSEGQVINLEQVDTDFTQTFDLELIAGRLFTNEMERYKDDGPIIINEAAVKAYNFTSAEEAIGATLMTIVGDTINMEVVGVVNDFFWNSLQIKDVPYLFALNHEYGAFFSFKVNLSDVPETIAYIKSTYDEVFPGNPFTYFFMDDNFNLQYQSDVQFKNLFSAFSILAIFIACLGLFALISFSATLRIKEIGIRKVLGASISHLMMLLSREYLILLLIAILVAAPAVFFGGRAWLDNYAYRVDVGADLFLIPGLVLLLISLLTVGYRTYASANANPVESLKTE
ncbi:MAG: FtsX-like permease family protein [Cyclobacteriaceae bacterium]